jgi:hypothetical protein
VGGATGSRSQDIGWRCVCRCRVLRPSLLAISNGRRPLVTTTVALRVYNCISFSVVVMTVSTILTALMRFLRRAEMALYARRHN